MDGINIGEVARRAGLHTSAIRFYESAGLLPRPQRVSGWRRYDSGVVDRLRVIRAARDLGFALDEIRTLLNGFPTNTPPPARWRSLAQKKLPEVEAMIQRATDMKYLLEAGLRCECVSIEACFIDGCSPDSCETCS